MFHENGVACLLSKSATVGDTKPPTWLSIPEAIERGVDLVSDYPTCKHLFRSLCDPQNLQIDTLVRTVGLVRPSQTAREIIDGLKTVSKHMASMNSKQAAATVKPLRLKNIFPVSDHAETVSAQNFDRLVCADDQSWFINDSHEFKNSFAGRVPLLTATPTTVTALGDLLGALNLESRKLSKAAIERSIPRGWKRYLAEETAFLRSRLPFVTA